MINGTQQALDAGVLPDPTAVLVAVWRAMHLRLDPPPHVFRDDLGLRMADCTEGRSTLGIAASVPPRDGTPWTDAPLLSGPLAAPFRPLMVGRARCNEELLARLVDTDGLDQYVILGAGLDSFALREVDRLRRLTVYEIDRPGPQAWKQRRLAELGVAVPPGLRFVPVDFEGGEAWTTCLTEAGFDRNRPAFLSAVGLTQYIDEEATRAIFGEAAALAPGTALFCGFIVPEDLVDPAERDCTARIKEVVAGRGCPFVSEYSPEHIAGLAQRAGLDDVRLFSPGELTARYFAGRPDGLRIPSVEHFLFARRT